MALALAVFATVYLGMILGRLPRLALDRTGIALLGAIALLALACAANVGSAATLIGNPQNILIGQALALSFNGYLFHALVPAVLGLVATWAIVAWQYRAAWQAPARVRDAGADGVAPAFDAWQSAKGLAAAVALLVVFVATSWPREIAALAAAGLLLLSRRLHSRDKLGLVDWQLLVLFLGLFVVNGALAATGAPADAVAWLRAGGIDLETPGWLFAATVLLSNLVSNVPAVMLLIPVTAATLAIAAASLAWIGG